MKLDENLVDEARRGKIVLFLGAGASRGAQALDGRTIPDAVELGRKISKTFLGDRYAERDFKSIYDFACSRASVRDVQKFLYEELDAYHPAQFHELIPRFIWAGIATTNYDFIIERAYRKVGTESLQHLRPYRSDADIPPGDFKPSELLYNKIHGCISEYQKVHPPLIASTEQIIDHKDGRAGQFQQFLEWAQTRPIVFAGYRADDSNLRALINQIVKEGDKRPRHYIVRPDLDNEERIYWEERRFRGISMTFEEFLVELDNEFPAAARVLAGVPAGVSKTTFSRHISVVGIVESDLLVRYFSSDCEHVSIETSVGEFDAHRFYSGFDIGWAAVSSDLDVRRRITQAILADHVIASTNARKTALIVLKAHAGAGKSVILRRLAWDAVKLHQKLVLYVNRHGRIDPDRFEEIFSLTNKPVFLIVDNAAHFSGALESLILRGRRNKWPLTIITAERINEWNVTCENLEEEVDREYELKYLSKAEIAQLLEKLRLNNCLGFLAAIPEHERAKQLEERYGRQLLVALHEATKNANFRDIVADEYKNITPTEARLLYLDICALNRFGSPVRAGLIARVHGIGFDEFRERFFRPLEEVVELRMNNRTGDYVYEARHPFIAEMVYSSSLISGDERFDNMTRILGKLNPTYSYDQEVLFHLIRASTLGELFPDGRKGVVIYEKAIEAFGENAGILHQWGLYEMHRAGDMIGLDQAQKLFNDATELEPNNRAMQHSLAELALRRARFAVSDSEREVFRRDAIRRAQSLSQKGNSSYPFHTMAKACVDELADALKRYEAEPDELRELAVNEAIKNAEETLRKGLQRFPSDDRLLTTEAELSKVLNNAPRALQALTRAFKSNPKSELVARRLATTQRANGDVPGAITTLREALSYNSGSTYLNFDMAASLRELAPDADQKDRDGAISFHFARGFHSGDRNYQARFWCARQYWIEGKYNEARALFDVLQEARVSYRLKVVTQGSLLDGAGNPVRFNGQVEKVAEGFGFIRIDGSGASVYFSSVDNPDHQNLERDTRVTFAIAFSLRGPQAIDISELLI